MTKVKSQNKPAMFKKSWSNGEKRALVGFMNELTYEQAIAAHMEKYNRPKSGVMSMWAKVKKDPAFIIVSTTKLAPVKAEVVENNENGKSRHKLSFPISLYKYQIDEKGIVIILR